MEGTTQKTIDGVTYKITFTYSRESLKAGNRYAVLTYVTHKVHGETWPKPSCYVSYVSYVPTP